MPKKTVPHPHAIGLREIPVGEKVAFFVRDPLKRFASAFYSRRRQGRPRYSVPWGPKEERAFQRFATPNELASALASADSEARAAASDAMRSIGLVRRSMVSWVESVEYLGERLGDIAVAGRLETIDDDFRRMCILAGVPPVPLPTDDEGTHRNPPDSDYSLSKDAVGALTEHYAADFALVAFIDARLRG